MKQSALSLVAVTALLLALLSLLGIWTGEANFGYSAIVVGGLGLGLAALVNASDDG